MGSAGRQDMKGDKVTDNVTDRLKRKMLKWIKAWVWFSGNVLHIFSKFTLRPKKTWPLIIYSYVKWFFPDNLLHLNGHVIDHALN